MSFCLSATQVGANLFRFNEVSKKVEYFKIIDASPFSQSRWEKDIKVKVISAPSSKETLELLDESKKTSWNLTGKYGIDLNPDSSRYVGTTIAVLDTGIINHVEFKGRLLSGFDFIKNTDLSLDGDGRDSDFSPFQTDLSKCFGNNNSNIGHGTHVAGIIAGEGGDGDFLRGVVPNANILPVRVLGPCGGELTDIIDGILWSAGESVDGVSKRDGPVSVINLSLGGYGSCPKSLQKVIDHVSSKNIVVVVAAGNDSINLDQVPFFPANCNNVITVGATSIKGNIANYSNYKEGIVFAPGGESDNGILSTFIDDDFTGTNYDYLYGSSMAAPHVSGLAAIVKDKFSSMNVLDVRELLKNTSNKKSIVSYKNLIHALDNDELVFERFEINPESPSGGFGNDVTSVSGCGSMNIDSGNGPTSIFSILVGLCLYLVIMGGMRQFVSIP